MDGLQDNNQINTLKTKAVVAAHDKDINSLAVAPNDNFACSGSQVSKMTYYSTGSITIITTWYHVASKHAVKRIVFSSELPLLCL